MYWGNTKMQIAKNLNDYVKGDTCCVQLENVIANAWEKVIQKKYIVTRAFRKCRTYPNVYGTEDHEVIIRALSRYVSQYPRRWIHSVFN